MIILKEDPDINLLQVELSGKLHDDDYKAFVPAVDAAVDTHGKVRMIVQLRDFHGWDAHALWDDIKFATTHCQAMEKLAIVGENRWESWMAKICQPFTKAQVKYFDVAHGEEALDWVQQ